MPNKVANLTTSTSTGTVLSDALFESFYDVGFPPTAHFGIISGGADLAASFGTINPILPLYTGGYQSFYFSYAVLMHDQNCYGDKGVKGVPVEDSVPDELLCPKAFPSMLIMFWGDPSVKCYFDNYFTRFDNS